MGLKGIIAIVIAPRIPYFPKIHAMLANSENVMAYKMLGSATQNTGGVGVAGSNPAVPTNFPYIPPQSEHITRKHCMCLAFTDNPS
jgi:hypothetical protein